MTASAWAHIAQARTPDPPRGRLECEAQDVSSTVSSHRGKESPRILIAIGLALRALAGLAALSR
jgi:hypothetical protein